MHVSLSSFNPTGVCAWCEREKETIAAVSGEIEAGKDKVFITSSTVPNGMTIHIEAQEGLLKVLPTLVQSLPMPAGIPGF